MALVRWDPWGDLASLQREMNELFSRTTGGDSRTAAYRPAIDAFTTSEGMVVRMELPGYTPDQVDISVHEGVLTVSGERAKDVDIQEDQWLRRERVTGRFERSFTLPKGTHADAITAQFEHGLLELTIPHPPESKPRKVAISGGASENESVDVG